MTLDYKDRCRAAARFLNSHFGKAPKVSITLGSGLGGFADQMTNVSRVSFSDIPEFPRSSVAGHSGEILVGEFHGIKIVGQKGRVHTYEGHSAADAALPVRALALWGVEDFIITNAAGGLNAEGSPGDLMAITSDYSFGIESSSRAISGDEFGPQFFDVTRPYDEDLINQFMQFCAQLEVPAYRGSYVMCAGPRYETASEILDLSCRRSLMLASASPELAFGAVGMSTVPEVHALAQMRAGGKRLRVLGISMITNLAAGISATLLNHAEVLEMGEKGGARLACVLAELLPKL